MEGDPERLHGVCVAILKQLAEDQQRLTFDDIKRSIFDYENNNVEKNTQGKKKK